ncbi:MAG TPA: methanol/ethanol family PQQ-dependent dehydrogenase [Gemmatimonadales bacterium]|nr:methanol/ethanol family PQQ-dependent dehydrogenase [Gemmatimonadales bacterium]
MTPTRAAMGTALAVLIAAAGACSGSGTETGRAGVPRTETAAAAASANGSEGPAAVNQPGAPNAGEWTLPGRDFAGTRYTPLAQITPANVKNLKVAWTFSTGLARGFEGQPLIVDNTMYIVTPWPNKVFAIDLTDPSGPLKWSYNPPTATAAQGEACCDVVNRGASYADGKIVFNRLDNTTVALDAKTGKTAWQTKLGDIALGETMTMAPLVVNGRVFVGNSGAELGVHGWITALDLKDGHILWRAYSTGPDSLVKIGPDFKPFYADLRGKDLGTKTWAGDDWKLGGGTVWGWVSYDPETDLIFYGTANPGVWNPDLRPGDNLWTAAVFARDPATGEARWAYQYTPHDSWDYDGINESIPVDLTIDGKPRKALVHFDRNGFGSTLDRTTGEVLVAQPFKYINWSTGVDLKTGRPQRVASKETHQGINTQAICPSSTGARDQQPAAFSPRTHLFYTPSTNLCMDYEGTEVSYIAGTPYLGAEVQMYAGPGGKDARGEFLAWDPVAGKKVWGITERFPVWSGPVVTGSDLVFYGTMDGWFKAVDAKSGTELWKFKTGSGIVGNAVTFMGPDGKQYVAIYSGVGGWYGAVALGLSPSDPTAALGAVGAGQDLPQYTAPGGTVYVFALP